MRETWVQSMGWEDPLEEGMATHSSIVAWKIPMDRGAWQAIVHAVAKGLDTTEQLSPAQHNNYYLPSAVFVLSSWYFCNKPFLVSFCQMRKLKPRKVIWQILSHHSNSGFCLWSSTLLIIMSWSGARNWGSEALYGLPSDGLLLFLLLLSR